MAAGEFVDPGQGGDPQHGLVVNIAGTVDQILTQGAAEQVNILRGIADVMTQIVHIDLASINTVYQHITAVRLVKPHQQFRQ